MRCTVGAEDSQRTSACYFRRLGGIGPIVPYDFRLAGYYCSVLFDPGLEFEKGSFIAGIRYSFDLTDNTKDIEDYKYQTKHYSIT